MKIYNWLNIRYILILTIVLSTFYTKAQDGKLQGKVYDALNNEPLAFVNIIIDGTQTGTTSDFDGNFTITGLKPGFIRLKASFIGYQEAISSEILISNAKIAYIEIPMKQIEQKVEEVVVKATPFRRTEESPVSLRSIGISEIENNPGSNRDISKVIQSFPGVASSVSYRNDIIIRGGGPSESKFYLDGIEVPNINHFATQGASGGPVGILNADFIREVDYYSGAFPANRGNALSGIFEFKQKDGNPDKAKFRATVGASEIAATIDGPIGKKTSYIASARQSYLQFLFDVIGLPFLPTFNDFQFKTRTKIDVKNEISFIGLGAIDYFKLNTGIKNPTEDQQYILSSIPVNEQWNYALGTVYKHFRKNSYQTYVLSRNHLNNKSYKYKDNDDSNVENKILDYNSQEIENKLRFENISRLNTYKIIYGFGLEYIQYQNNTKQKRFLNNDVFRINYNTELSLVKYNFFGQVSKSFYSERLNLSAGLRTDANNYSSSMSNILDQLSPRFSGSYFINDKFSVNFNFGRYFQLPSYTSLGFKLNNKLINKDNGLKFINTNHYIAGVEYRPNSASQVAFEIFSKKYGNYPYSIADSMSIANKGADYGVVGDEAVSSSSEGRAYGFEVIYRIKSAKGFNFNLSYTYVRSEFKANWEEKYTPSSWDNRHILTTTSTANLKNNWKIGFKWRFLGGAPYTPYDLEKSSLVSAWDSRGAPFMDFSKLNSERLDPFHQLDIRVDKGWFFKKWSLMLYLDIQNFYNFKAKQQNNVVREKNSDGSYILINNDLQYKLKKIQNTSGTVLPTIGIMIEL